MKNIVVISAHPDDETLGMGGTILKHKQAGDNLWWIIATEISVAKGYNAQMAENRTAEIKEVASRYAFKEVFTLGYPTTTLSSSSLITMVPAISAIFSNIQPEVVYCVHHADAHSDHRILFDAVMSCTKSFRYPTIKKVLTYECISETEFAPAIPGRIFMPTVFIDITPYFAEKLSIMDVYASELGNHPFPRSKRNIEALATFRGATAGIEYAEAFQLIKEILE